MNTKTQMMWEISREAEDNFFKDVPVMDNQEIRDLFKMIRGCEYCRAKEDVTNEILKWISEIFLKERKKGRGVGDIWEELEKKITGKIKEEEVDEDSNTE